MRNYAVGVHHLHDVAVPLESEDVLAVVEFLGLLLQVVVAWKVRANLDRVHLVLVVQLAVLGPREQLVVGLAVLLQAAVLQGLAAEDVHAAAEGAEALIDLVDQESDGFLLAGHRLFEEANLFLLAL